MDYTTNDTLEVLERYASSDSLSVDPNSVGQKAGGSASLGDVSMQNLFDYVRDETLGVLERYAPSASLSIDPKAGDPASLGDMGVHDLHDAPPAAGAPPKIYGDWTKFGLANSIDMIVTMALFFNSLNMQQLNKDADQVQILQQEVENLRRCYDSISSAASGNNTIGDETMTFTDIKYGPDGKLETVTTTETVGQWLGNQTPSVKLRTTNPGSETRDANAQLVQGVLSDVTTRLNQAQSTMSSDQQLMNTNIETAKNLISITTTIIQNCIPRSL